MQCLVNLVYDFTCHIDTVSLRKETQCYNKIPVDHEVFKFTDPVTTRLRSHEAKTIG